MLIPTPSGMKPSVKEANTDFPTAAQIHAVYLHLLNDEAPDDVDREILECEAVEYYQKVVVMSLICASVVKGEGYCSIPLGTAGIYEEHYAGLTHWLLKLGYSVTQPCPATQNQLGISWYHRGVY